MRGFILAAGLGTRLRPLTETLPKPLVEVGGMPLLERAIRQLAEAGVRDIGVNVFHLADQIVDFLGNGSRWGVRVTCFDERPEVLGTGGGLKHAEPFLRRDGNQAFLLANADVWHDFDLGRLLTHHRPDTLATLAVHRTPRRPELHNVACTLDPGARRQGRIAHIAGQPDGSKASDFLAIYTGVAVYSTRLMDWLPAGKVSGLVTHGLVPAMAAGETVRWYEPPGAWFDCGTHAEVLRASHHALQGRGTELAGVKREAVQGLWA